MGAIASGGDPGAERRRRADDRDPGPSDRRRWRRASSTRCSSGARLPRRARSRSTLRGTPAILVDDGLATGATMRAAIAALRDLGVAEIVVAVPTAPRETCEALAAEVDEVVCATTPEPFTAVGLWYRDFTPVSDDEVRGILAEAAVQGPQTRAAVVRHARRAARRATSTAVLSLGARQSPRGDSEPPEPTFGALGSAERLNWLVWKKRSRNTSSQCLISASEYWLRRSARDQVGPAARARGRPTRAGRGTRPCSGGSRSAACSRGRSPGARRDRRRSRCRRRAGRCPDRWLGISSGEIAVSRIDRRTSLASLAVLAGVDRPPEQELDQRLRDRGVDVVVRHLVADAVRAPPERQLRQIAGADDERARGGWRAGTGARCARRPGRSRR